jgi:hypothetical protein
MGIFFALRQNSAGSPAPKSDDILACYQAQAAANPKAPETLLKWGHVLPETTKP